MELHTRMIRLAVTILTCVVTLLAGCGDDDAKADAGTDPTLCNPYMGGVGQCACATGTLGYRNCVGTGDVGRWGNCMCNEPQPPTPCTVGATFACYCPTGSMGRRECRAMNTYTACMCGNDTNDDAGQVDAAAEDSGNDDGG